MEHGIDLTGGFEPAPIVNYPNAGSDMAFLNRFALEDYCRLNIVLDAITSHIKFFGNLNRLGKNLKELAEGSLPDAGGLNPEVVSIIEERGAQRYTSEEWRQGVEVGLGPLWGIKSIKPTLDYGARVGGVIDNINRIQTKHDLNQKAVMQMMGSHFTEEQVEVVGVEEEREDLYTVVRYRAARLVGEVGKRLSGKPVPAGGLQGLSQSAEALDRPAPRIREPKGLQVTTLTDIGIKVDLDALRGLEIPAYNPRLEFMDNSTPRIRRLIEALQPGTLGNPLVSNTLRVVLNPDNPDSDSTRANLSNTLRVLDKDLIKMEDWMILKLRDGREEAAFFFCPVELLKRNFPPNIKDGLFAISST